MEGLDKTISRERAEKGIKKTCGYQTDIDKPGSMSHNLIELPEKATKIRFRFYHKTKENDNPHPYFSWSDWYKIDNTGI